MSSSRSKGKSSRRSSQLPTGWSTWEWSFEYKCLSRWRLNGAGAAEYEYNQQEPQAVPRSNFSDNSSLDPIGESSKQYSYQKFDNNYTTAATDASVDNVTRNIGGLHLSSSEQQQQQQPGAAQDYNTHIATRDPRTTEESFDRNYKVHYAWKFKYAKVFKVLWAEPQGSDGGTVISYRKGDDGQKCWQKVRRFVIIKPMKGHCLCLPIMTYQGQGTNKPGVHAEDHTIIYTGKLPNPVEGETQRGLNKWPIKVVPESSRHKLDNFSRLNYAKVYTVEYNVKVWFIGKVSKSCEEQLASDYNNVHPPIQSGNAQLSLSSQNPYINNDQGTANTYQLAPISVQAPNNQYMTAYPAYTASGWNRQISTSTYSLNASSNPQPALLPSEPVYQSPYEAVEAAPENEYPPAEDLYNAD